jgi:hypothetical protein
MADKQANSKAVWVVTFLLVALFVWSGANMVVSEQWPAHFRRWGYPEWLCPVIGLAEVAGAVLLLVRRVAWIGATTLTLLMACGVVTMLRHESAAAALMPALLLTSLASLAYYRFPRRQVA